MLQKLQIGFKEETMRGTGGVVAIVHGFNSHSGYYTWVAEQFVSAGLAVYALDLRGRGKSGWRALLGRGHRPLRQRCCLPGRSRQDSRARPAGISTRPSAGGVISSVYTLEHQHDLAGLICESFAFQVPAPDFVLSVLKGISHLIPHAHVFRLKNEDFSRDPATVKFMNEDPLIANEVQPAQTVAQMVLADER